METYARIIVDIRNSNVDQVFDYRIPEGMEIREGTRVIVPFGRGVGRATEGFVVGTASHSDVPPERIKPITRRLAEDESLLPAQVALAFRLVKKYHCMLCDALRLMIPAQMRKGKVSPKMVRVVMCRLDAAQAEEALAQIPKRAKVQRAVLELMTDARSMLLSDLVQLYPSAAGAAKVLEAKGLLAIEAVELNRAPYRGLQPVQQAPFLLSDEQSRAVDTICKSLQGESGRYLLHGVTGSGKTEVYLQTIARCVERGKSAIVLVPEISLTPQTLQRFRERFEQVAVLHSRLGAGERYDEWRRIRSGTVQVVIGARSAIFAPLENLGLIIIDEEHEQSYRSESTPRYCAIEVAHMRCEMERATLVLGSATPSIETYYSMKQGDYVLLRLHERVNKEAMPPVQLIDMRQELRKGNRSIFSGELYECMKHAIEEGEQVILFINRRGYSSFMMCRGCGLVFKCNDCDVSLTYHKAKNVLVCHYCQREWRIPEKCPSCSKPYLKHFGVATEKVEEQCKELFPGVNVLRMDYDTTRTKDAHLTILEKFRDKKAQILVGTQMIAKGLDFPMVTLVGVVAADATLFLPGYRSVERAFQLVMQVAGRAGRAAHEGMVVAQTFSPSHPALQFAVRHDYEGFYEYEIANREKSDFPPFGVFVRYLLTGLLWEDVMAAGKRLYESVQAQLRRLLGERYDRYVVHLYANAAPISRIKGRVRYQVLLKMRRFAQDEQVIESLMQLSPQAAGEVYCTFEVNPLNMF
ncbi:MAG: replication restart helicase PriA [Christensenellales bacterium]